jgi:hypothetical protein
VGGSPGDHVSVLLLPPTSPAVPTGCEARPPEGPSELGFSEAPVIRAFTLADLSGDAVRRMETAVLPDRSADRSGRRMTQEKGDWEDDPSLPASSSRAASRSRILKEKCDAMSESELLMPAGGRGRRERRR